MRKPLTSVYVNVELGSTGTTPEFGVGELLICDSGHYVYGQANGAIDEGAICKFVQGTFDFDEVTTAESGSTNTPIGVCVTDGGLADNYWGWFWRGGPDGYEYVYVQDIATDTQVTTTSTAGEGGSGGDNIYGLFTNENNSTAGLTKCRSNGFLSTNFTTAAT